MKEYTAKETAGESMSRKRTEVKRFKINLECKIEVPNLLLPLSVSSVRQDIQSIIAMLV